MKRTDTTRRRRANTKAWVYLALFGPGEDTDEPADDPTSETGSDGHTNDGQPPEV
jgi:hypothetical protein